MDRTKGASLWIQMTVFLAMSFMQGARGMLQCPGLSTPYYKAYPAKYLVDGVLMRTSSPTAANCVSDCNTLMLDCRGVNFNPRNTVCLLLSKHRGSPGARLIDDTNGFIYYEAQCTPLVTPTPQPTGQPTPQPTGQPAPTPFPPGPPGNPGLDSVASLPIAFLAVGSLLFVFNLIIVIVHWSQLSEWFTAINKLD